jgi:imidazole glycerol-phosphate synthase subunit HisH
MRIGLLNLDVGNIKSVYNVLKKIDPNITLVNNNEEYTNCDIIFVSGVASFDSQVKKIKDKNFFEILKNERNKKIIGICSGMQIMFNSSLEGKENGLGIFNENLSKFSKNPNTHIGWNKIKSDNNTFNNKEYYFCHSYFAPANRDYLIASSNYGQEFSSIVKKENFYGIQFHPEKSGQNGLLVLDYIINY